MQYIHAIEDRLHDELKEISSKLSQGDELSAQCLDNIKDISIALNQFTTYEAMKNSGYSPIDGYSNARDGMSRGRMVYNNAINNMRNGRSYHGGDDWEREQAYYGNSMRQAPNMY